MRLFLASLGCSACSLLPLSLINAFAAEPESALPAPPERVAGAAAQAVDAPARMLDIMDEPASANVAEGQLASPRTDVGPAAAAESPTATALTLGELRDRAAQLPSPTAYLELLQALRQDAAGLKQGEARVELERESEQLWTKALSIYPDDTLLLLAHGDELLSRGSLQAAWEAYLRGEARSPADPRWTQRLGLVCQQAGDYPKAITYFNESLAMAHAARVVAALALCHRQNGDPGAALSCWNKALAQHPADPELRMLYGKELYDLASYDEALEQFQRGSELDRRNDLFHNRAALCLMQLQRPREALTEVQQALQLRPHATYYFNLAAGNEALGEWEAAENWYRSGLARYPEDSLLSTAYSALLAQLGRGGEALSRLHNTVDVQGAQRGYPELAALAEEQGDLDGAMSAWQSALREDPSSPLVLKAAACFYARCGERETLVELVRVARNRLESEDLSELLRELAQTYLVGKAFAEGVTVFSSLMEAHPDVATVYNQLGLLQHMAGDSALGLSTVRRGLAEVNMTSLGRYLETFLTAKVQGPDAALTLGPSLVDDPEADHGAFELYAGLLLQLEKWPEAESVAAAGQARFPRRGPLLELRSRALLGQGKLSETAELLGSGEFARIEFSGKGRLLGQVYLELSNYPKAVAALTGAVRNLSASATPQEAAGLLAELAEAQYWAGEFSAARSSCSEALALYPATASAQVWLGWALLALDDLPGALHAFGEAQPDAADLTNLAWLALGRARASAKNGQRADAYVHWQWARTYSSSVQNARLDALVLAVKRELAF